VLTAGDSGGLGAALSALGAAVVAFEPVLDEAGEGGAAWVAERAPFDALVFDASDAAAGMEAARMLLDAAWIAVAAAANGAFIPRERGRIVLIAPPGAVAAAGLENLARTLSVEWARYGITVVALAPSAATAAETLETVVAFLLSSAGGYYSGARLELDPLGA
jgi:hypothetical protein